MNESDTWFKVVVNAVIITISAILAFMGQTAEVFSSFIALMALDYVTGLMASSRMCEDISSSRMKAGVMGKMALIFLVFGVAAFIKILGVDFSFLMYTTIGILAAAELLSLVSNVHCIITGVRQKEQIVVTDIFRNILVKILKDKGVLKDDY